jgi:hypothetical protein
VPVSCLFVLFVAIWLVLVEFQVQPVAGMDRDAAFALHGLAVRIGPADLDAVGVVIALVEGGGDEGAAGTMNSARSGW